MKYRGARLSLIAISAALLLLAALTPAGANAGWILVWDAAENPAPTNEDADHPDIAVDQARLAHVVWEGWKGDDFNVWGALRALPAGDWSDPFNVSQVEPGTAYPEMARIAVGTDGAAHAVWESWQATIHYAARPIGGEWGAPQQISVDGPLMGQAVLALHPTTNARFAAWEQEIEYTDVFTSQSAIFFTSAGAGMSGDWAEPINIAGLTRNATAPDLLVDSAGAVHAVWAAELDSDTAQIFYRRRSPAGVWGPILQVAQRSGACETPSLSLDRLFRLPAVAWSEEGDAGGRDIFFASQYSSGSWSQPANLSNSANVSRSPDTLIMSDGRILTLWVEMVQVDEMTEAYGIYYATRERFGEGWSAPRAIEEPANGRYILKPRWALDSADGVHLVWSAWEEGLPVRVWYRHGQAGAETPTYPLYLPLILLQG